MKIIDSQTNEIKFYDLQEGDVFRYHGDMCMRIVQYNEDSPTNAVDLESGELYFCDGDEWVTPFPNAKLSLY